MLTVIAGLVAYVQRDQARQSADTARAAEDQAVIEADNVRAAEQQAVEAADEASAARRDAEIEALVGRIDSLRSTQRDTAALLALEAYRLADTARTRSSLLSTFTDGSGFLDAHRFAGGLPDEGQSGIVLPDGESAYFIDIWGALRPYDLDTGHVGNPLPALDNARDSYSILAASPDSALVAQAARSSPGGKLTTTIGIYDTSTGALRFTPAVMDGAITGATFTTDASVLAVSLFPDGRLLAFDSATGVQVAATAPGVPPLDNEPEVSGVLAVGDEVILGSAYDGTLRVFDATTFQLRRTITLRPKTVSYLGDAGDGTIVTSGSEGLARVDLASGAVLWQHDENQVCFHLTVVAARDRFYCGNVFGRLEERDLATGSVPRRLDAQNGGSGVLWPARGGRELVSFGANEPVVSRWRLDGSGPITRVVAPGYNPVEFSPSGERLILDRGVSGAESAAMVVDVDTGDIIGNLDHFTYRVVGRRRHRHGNRCQQQRTGRACPRRPRRRRHRVRWRDLRSEPYARRSHRRQGGRPPQNREPGWLGDTDVQLSDARVRTTHPDRCGYLDGHQSPRQSRRNRPRPHVRAPRGRRSHL